MAEGINWAEPSRLRTHTGGRVTRVSQPMKGGKRIVCGDWGEGLDNWAFRSDGTFDPVPRSHRNSWRVRNATPEELAADGLATPTLDIAAIAAKTGTDAATVRAVLAAAGIDVPEAEGEMVRREAHKVAQDMNLGVWCVSFGERCIRRGLELGRAGK